jgi:ABC-type sulfate transport system substrate-binding protein
MTVLFSQKYEVTDVVDDVQILDVDKIKESFKAVLIDAVDEMELDGMKQLIFDDMKLRYYPVQNTSDENEYTYIPAWEFSTKWDIKNRNDKTFCVYINAIDGTLMGVKQN